MPFIPAVNAIKVTVNMKLSNVDALNVFYIEDTVARPGVADIEQALIAVRDEWWPVWRPRVPASVTLYSIHGRGMTEPDDVQTNLFVNENGLGAGDHLPANCALVTTFKTGLTGRSRQGRAFMAGLREGDTVGNNATNNAVTAAVGAWTALAAELITIGLRIVVASFIHDHDFRETALLTPIITVGGDTRMDSQRGRLPRTYAN